MKEIIIDELLKLEIKDELFLNEYINFCLINNNPDTYDVCHHILPKFNNSPFRKYADLKKNEWNCSHLSYKNHFIAHWLLVKAIKHKSISFAFVAMKNKDLKNKKITEQNIDEFSYSYNEIMTEYKKFMSEQFKNKTCVLDTQTGKTKLILVSEYKNNDNYKSIFTGRMSVNYNGENIRINSKDYNPNIHHFHFKNMANYFNIHTLQYEHININDKKEFHYHQNSKIVVKRNNKFLKIKINEIRKNEKIYDKNCLLKIKKEPKKCKFYFYNITNKTIIKSTKNPDYKIYVNLSLKRKIKVFNIFTYKYETFENINQIDTNIHLLLSKYYKVNIDKNNRIFYLDKNKIIPATKSNIKKYINHNFVKYETNENTYKHTYNKVICKNSKGQIFRVEKDIFDNDENLVGITSKKYD